MSENAFYDSQLNLVSTNLNLLTLHSVFSAYIMEKFVFCSVEKHWMLEHKASVFRCFGFTQLHSSWLNLSPFNTLQSSTFYNTQSLPFDVLRALLCLTQSVCNVLRAHILFVKIAAVFDQMLGYVLFLLFVNKLITRWKFLYKQGISVEVVQVFSPTLQRHSSKFSRFSSILCLVKIKYLFHVKKSCGI